jgi:hypothetical protein
MLDADFTACWIRVAGREHLGVEHRVPNGVAMNLGAMVVRELRGFCG